MLKKLTLSEYLAIVFFLVVVTLVFQQIATSLTEQGIASGSPYKNAAAFPKAVALIMIALLTMQVIGTLFSKPATTPDKPHERPRFAKAIILLGLFFLYLALIGQLGYHITTAPFLFATMALAGMQGWVSMLIISLSVSTALAFSFEVLLKVVLPGGVFNLNIPW